MMTESDLSSPTLTSSSGDLSPQKMDDKASHRKSNKPMMEKKRRARINSCLTQLKSLVLQAMKKDNSQYSKLEKADILELTVKHLRNIQRCQVTNLAQVPDAISKYRAGFNECANEVIRYLGASEGVNNEARTRILSHLASILSPINSLALQPGPTAILPAPSPAQQQHQQQQHHLQQLQQLHQQHHQGVFLNSSGQQVTIDANNNATVLPHSALLATTSVNTPNSKHIISGPPAAVFQAPIATTAGLQIPCIATTAMTATQLHLVPGTLSTGQVALVFAPQTAPVYTSGHQGIRNHLDHGPPVKLEIDARTSLQSPHISMSDKECNARVSPDNSVTVAMGTRLGNSQRVHSPGHSYNPYHAGGPTSLHVLSSLTREEKDRINSSESFGTVLLPRTTATASFIINGTSYSGHHSGSNVVRTTSTWRPW